MIDDIKWKDKAYQILGMLQDIAPDSNAQNICTKLYNDASMSSMHDKSLLLIMTNLLYDGLAYGNWPWIVYKP